MLQQTHMVWITEDTEIREELYNLNINNTLAIEYQSSSITIVKYGIIKNIYDKKTKNYSESNLAEPYNIICDIEVKKDPSSDFSEKKSISYDKENERIYLKDGVNRFKDIIRINTTALEATYDTGDIYGVCDECGKEIDINFKEKTTVTSKNKMKKDQNGELITPCCRSKNWTTKYRSK